MRFYAVCIFSVCIFSITVYISNAISDVTKSHSQEHAANFTADAHGPANFVDKDKPPGIVNLDEFSHTVDKIFNITSNGAMRKLGGWVTFAAGGAAIFLTRITYRF
ncbi:uncharacterized protein LOC144475006 [Augochlora pura]